MGVGPGTFACSFCGNSKDDVRKLIGSQISAVHICNECVDHCNEIIIEDGDDEGNPPPWWTWEPVRRDTTPT